MQSLGTSKKPDIESHISFQFVIMYLLHALKLILKALFTIFTTSTLHFFQRILGPTCIADNSHEMPSLIFPEK